jgi:hypothetical protein
MLRLPARLLTPRFAVLHLGEKCLHGASLALVEMKATINVPVWTKAEVSAASRAAVSTNCDSTSVGAAEQALIGFGRIAVFSFALKDGEVEPTAAYGGFCWSVCCDSV